MSNISIQAIKAAKYNQILNEFLIDPLGLRRNILKDIPEWSNEFKTKFTSSITKNESTIKKYFSELVKFLKWEGFPVTANLREYITLERIKKNEKAGRSMYYVKRIWKKISPKQKNSHNSSSMETNQQQTSNQRIEEEPLHSNHQEIFISASASQIGLESNGIPTQSMNAMPNNQMIFSSFEFQNRSFSEHPNEQNSIQNDRLNAFLNELIGASSQTTNNSLIGASSQQNNEQPIPMQNNNHSNLIPNFSFSNAMPNNGTHSKTLDSVFNLVQSLWPQIEKYLHPERNTGEIVWKDCCRSPTTFCYYEEKKVFDTSKAQTHEGRCGERKDLGKVFLCVDCYIRRFRSG